MNEAPKSQRQRRRLKRRSLLYAGVAGRGCARRRRRGLVEVASGQGVEGGAAAIWAMSFDTPAGAPSRCNLWRGHPCWSTSGPPGARLVWRNAAFRSFYPRKAAKSWQVVGLAIDQPSAVRTFLQRTPISFPSALAGLRRDRAHEECWGTLSGGLPFTVGLSVEPARC